MTLELSKARKGDRFEARDGEVWTYERPYDIMPTFHLLRGSKSGVTVFAHDGKHSKYVKHHDLIRALDTPAPEAGADAELVRAFEEAAQHYGWAYSETDDRAAHEAFKVLEAARDALTTRIEVLTRTLDEAGKVIEPFAKIADAEVHGFEHDTTKLPVRIGYVRAARDWITKHGGGDEPLPR